MDRRDVRGTHSPAFALLGVGLYCGLFVSVLHYDKDDVPVRSHSFQQGAAGPALARLRVSGEMQKRHQLIAGMWAGGGTL